ncbi:MAG: ABC transporter ATP-binding protein [Vicinamibacterales bacterium]
MIHDLRTVLSWLTPRERARWYLLVPLVSLSALVEAIAALAVFGLLRLVVEPGRVRTAPVVSELWKAWGSDDPPAIIATLTIATALLYLARGVLLAGSEWMRERTLQQSAARTSERLFARYLSAGYLFHVRRQSASLIDEATRSTELAFQFVLSSSIHLFAETLTAIALVLVLALNAPLATLSSVALILTAVGLVVQLTRRVWVRLGGEEKQLAVAQLHVLQQSLGGIKDVIITGRQSFFEERFRHVRRALADLRQRRLWISSILRIGVETGLIVCMLVVIWMVIARGDVGPQTVSVLALFAYTGFRLVPSANRVMLNLGYLREGHVFVKSVAHDLHVLRGQAPRVVPEPVVTFERSITLEHVTLRYEAGDRPALADVSVSIRRGESIGIVGPTGAGKSTFVDVLLGLLTPTEGEVRVDGDPIGGRERGWQRLIGYVPQDVYLLDDTLRRNIAFGISDAAVDDAQLARAVSLARLGEVIAALPKGLETDVGENGVRLSGGQRQRVAIARALYHDPPVLVFDEATAALDNQTEREVTDAIAALRGDRTLIAIAHRLSTVQACDRLIYLRDGRIAGIGAYQALLADESFRKLT